MKREGPAMGNGARSYGRRGRSLYLLLVIVALGLAITLALTSEREVPHSLTVDTRIDTRSNARLAANSGQDVAQRPVASTIHLALQGYVEHDYGAERYVGPCDNAVSPRDLWKRCTKLWVDDGDRLAFLEGATFSEFSRWIFVAHLPNGQWTVTGEAPFDFFGDPTRVPWPQ